MNRLYTVILRNRETREEVSFTDFFPDTETAQAWARHLEAVIATDEVEVRECEERRQGAAG